MKKQYFAPEIRTKQVNWNDVLTVSTGDNFISFDDLKKNLDL